MEQRATGVPVQIVEASPAILTSPQQGHSLGQAAPQLGSPRRVTTCPESVERGRDTPKHNLAVTLSGGQMGFEDQCLPPEALPVEAPEAAVVALQHCDVTEEEMAPEEPVRGEIDAADQSKRETIPEPAEKADTVPANEAAPACHSKDAGNPSLPPALPCTEPAHGVDAGPWPPGRPHRALVAALLRYCSSEEERQGGLAAPQPDNNAAALTAGELRAAYLYLKFLASQPSDIQGISRHLDFESFSRLPRRSRLDKKDCVENQDSE